LFLERGSAPQTHPLSRPPTSLKSASGLPLGYRGVGVYGGLGGKVENLKLKMGWVGEVYWVLISCNQTSEPSVVLTGHDQTSEAIDYWVMPGHNQTSGTIAYWVSLALMLNRPRAHPQGPLPSWPPPPIPQARVPVLGLGLGRDADGDVPTTPLTPPHPPGLCVQGPNIM
jgi:hypothetical protein